MNTSEIQTLQNRHLKRKIHGVLSRKWDREARKEVIQYKKEKRWK